MMSQADGLVTAASILIIGCVILGAVAFVLRARVGRKGIAQSDTSLEVG